MTTDRQTDDAWLDTCRPLAAAALDWASAIGLKLCGLGDDLKKRDFHDREVFREEEEGPEKKKLGWRREFGRNEKIYGGEEENRENLRDLNGFHDTSEYVPTEYKEIWEAIERHLSPYPWGKYPLRTL